MNLGFDLDYPVVQEGGSAPPGMDIHPSRTQPAFQYLIHEQAKSLQVLQHEVGALLEFRDVVMETFPNLRQRLSPHNDSAAATTWEPGVKVKRKIVPKDGSSGNGIQDSGFSTETNSSSAKNTELSEAEEELWTLLDIIQTKGVQLQAELKELEEYCDKPKVCRRARSLDSILLNDNPELDLHGVEVLLDRLLRCERDHVVAQKRIAELEQRLGAGAGDNLAKAVTKPNRRKLEDILKEKNYLELQRRLIIAMVENQGLSAELESAQRARVQISHQLDKTRDELEDVRFHLEEKSIQLEGTRAQLRCLERLKPAPLATPESDTIDPLRRIGLTDSELARAREIFDAPSVLPVLALPMPNSLDNCSGKKSPTRRKPSRIPRKSPTDCNRTTMTIHMSYKKVSTTPTPTSSSTPSLRPSGNFSTVRSRDTLTRRSLSESARSLRGAVPGSTRAPTPVAATPVKTPTMLPSEKDRNNIHSKKPYSSKKKFDSWPRQKIDLDKSYFNAMKTDFH